MDSKISLKIIFTIFSIFIVHIMLYYISPSYGNYFKNVKYAENENNKVIEENSKTIETKNKKVSSYTWSKFIIPDINENNELIEEDNIKNESIEKNEDNEELDGELASISEVGDEFKEENWIQEILNLFENFDLKQKEETQNSSLFGLTNEYPYEYEEYYSRDKKMTLYIFKDKSYSDILNIFDVISYNLYFKIKKVNNFWDKSFYINLDADLDDSYIRFVFSYKNNNFWLKIKKDWYNEVRKILNSI